MFDVVGRWRGAMSRQIHECLLIKNSTSRVMNRKDVYNRCILPEIKLKDRGKRSQVKYSQGENKKK